jgi:hypothetical protein
MKYFSSCTTFRRYLYAVAVVLLGLVIGLFYYRRQTISSKAVSSVLSAYNQESAYAQITVDYPLNDTIFPPEIPAPAFCWTDLDPGTDRWLLSFEFKDKSGPMTFQAKSNELTLAAEDWESIKERSSGTTATVHVFGVNRSAPTIIRGHGKVTFETSRDKVAAPLFYREVRPPFKEAAADLSRVRWRFGSISSVSPRIVLAKPPVCGNCHSFSSDGKCLVMDVDYAQNKGSFATVQVKKKTVITEDDIDTWDDFDKERNNNTTGFVARVSPDGRYIVNMVEDLFIMAYHDFVDFSLSFFPIKGILAVYDREKETYYPLRGADDPEYVQTNPCWSPDGKTIVFVRAKASDYKHDAASYFLPHEESLKYLETIDSLCYELCRVPFNDGAGGKAEPLRGASNNGMSNFFPKYSPDGKWIVYCQAKSFMFLQPDSELHIIPAEGGESRRMRCNTPRMNSWHSWSPNGRWLVFTSKARSPFTQLFLTHIDHVGRSSPPVILTHMTAPDWAANIPEFVNTDPNAIKDIITRF